MLSDTIIYWILGEPNLSSQPMDLLSVCKLEYIFTKWLKFVTAKVTTIGVWVWFYWHSSGTSRFDVPLTFVKKFSLVTFRCWPIALAYWAKLHGGWSGSSHRRWHQPEPIYFQGKNMILLAPRTTHNIMRKVWARRVFLRVACGITRQIPKIPETVTDLLY